MSTYQAIWLCGQWARKAGITLGENPFVAPAYRRAWRAGWKGNTI
jgi:hypothetical protein